MIGRKTGACQRGSISLKRWHVSEGLEEFLLGEWGVFAEKKQHVERLWVGKLLREHQRGQCGWNRVNET